jgi:hypothetical protein
MRGAGGGAANLATDMQSIPLSRFQNLGEGRPPMNEPAKTTLDTRIASLDFTLLKRKLADSDEGAGWSPRECDAAEIEYKRFLTLKLRHPDVELSPNRVIDTFWHAHILDTRRYRDDCARIFGRFIDHFPYFGMGGADDARDLLRVFAQTQALYAEAFGEPMDNPFTTRCGDDHSCHAPSSCACRTPEACK